MAMVQSLSKVLDSLDEEQVILILEKNIPKFR